MIIGTLHLFSVWNRGLLICKIKITCFLISSKTEYQKITHSSTPLHQQLWTFGLFPWVVLLISLTEAPWWSMCGMPWVLDSTPHGENAWPWEWWESDWQTCLECLPLVPSIPALQGWTLRLRREAKNTVHQEMGYPGWFLHFHTHLWLNWRLLRGTGRQQGGE